MKMTEQELAAAVVAWLESAGWSVYQEVQLRKMDGIADIVGVKTNIVLVVECKTSLGLSVIEQALKWVGTAQLIAVAVPAPQRLQARRLRLGERILRQEGIGLFRVRRGFDEALYIEDTPDILPKWNCNMHRVSRGNSPWLDVICEEHKTFAKAGSAQGGHLTPFKQTMQLMTAFVHGHPGCTRKEIATGINHHYSDDASFKSAMNAIMMNGWCADVEERMEGRVYRYYASCENEDETL